MENVCVYVHINKANGKKYVGISKDYESRWARGRGYFRNKHFTDAINRYGWDNFEHVILFESIPRDLACIVEQELIKKYRTTDKRYGYNITNGGEHFLHSEESKKLMSKHRKGKGLHKFSEEHCRKISLHHGGGADKKKVVCVETSVIYESINDAARHVGITKKMISNCCNNVPHYNTAGGYHWKFAS